MMCSFSVTHLYNCVSGILQSTKKVFQPAVQEDLNIN